MASPSSLPPPARRILELARRDKASARAALAELTLDDQVELVCRAPAARRAELLDLAPAPEKLVPRLPEAELCFTVKALGLGDAGWILEHATREQIVACVDLDAWRADEPDPQALDAWLEALAEAGHDTLLRAARSLDPELVVLLLRHRIAVELKPGGDEDWQPPAGAQTLEGQFHFTAHRTDDDLAPVTRLLGALWSEDYWLYFRLMQGTIWELESDTQVWAQRWREGRLEDLGFRPRDECVLALYSRLPPEKLAALPEEARALDVSAWRLPVWKPDLPVASDARHLLFRAAAELGPDERAAFLYAFLALTNGVAVADRMPLGDAESSPAAIERAAGIASAGLEHLAREHGMAASEVLRRASLERLFRVGANLLGEGPPQAP